MKVLFISPYPLDQAPSQRFRFEQYFTILDQQNIKYDCRPFFSSKAWKNLYGGSSIVRFGFTLLGFIKRVFHLFNIWTYDVVFVHREATPIGPPLVEWVIAQLIGKKMIYDFDDAIWLEDPDEAGSLLAKLKWKRKVASICRWSWKVSVGNEYLASFARDSGARQVTLNPTTVDMELVHVGDKNQSDLPLTIGWTGTHSTMQYLSPLVPVLQRLTEKYNFRFLVISNREPDLPLNCVEYRPWNKETEVSDLLEMHIGVMPLADDLWSQGKCGFKAIQYLSLGIPAVVSPVGVNSLIVQEGVSGFLCDSPMAWYEKLKLLLEDEGLRTSFGKAGKQHVHSQYSTVSNGANFLSLFS